MVAQLDRTEFANLVHFPTPIVQQRNLSALAQTCVGLYLHLSNASKSIAPSWEDVMDSTDAKAARKSEVSIAGINVFKALSTAASKVRSEINRIHNLGFRDNEQVLFPVTILPTVWAKIQSLQDEIVPELRRELQSEYYSGLNEYTERVNQFLSIETWQLNPLKAEATRLTLLSKFPSQEELTSFLTVTIGRPTIVPGIQEQLSERERSTLDAIELYTQNLNNLSQAKMVEQAEQLAAEVLAELTDHLDTWVPGYKPIHTRNRLQKHLDTITKIQALGQQKAGNVQIGSLAEMVKSCISMTENSRIGSGNVHLLRKRLLAETNAIDTEISDYRSTSNSDKLLQSLSL
jgi:hypothetical protein